MFDWNQASIAHSTAMMIIRIEPKVTGAPPTLTDVPIHCRKGAASAISC